MAIIDEGNAPWDLAGLKLIIEEAGGRFSNLRGGDWMFKNSDCLASNGLVHDEVLKILNQK